MNNQRVILDAALERSVIRGTLTATGGGRRDFHGWLELNTALEAMLASATDLSPAHAAAASAVCRRLHRDGACTC